MTMVMLLLNLKISRFAGSLRKCSTFKTKLYMKTSLIDTNTHVDQLAKKYAPKLIYNSVIEKELVKHDLHLAYKTKSKTVLEGNETEPVPFSLRYLSDEPGEKPDDLKTETVDIVEDKNLVNFPYSKSYVVENSTETVQDQEVANVSPDFAAEAREEVEKRYELQKEIKNWMVAYDNYDDNCLSDNTDNLDDWRINYGTPDPKSRISNVPCGGCGALLHCKDTAIPGYIPSEIFKNSDLEGGVNLESITCQRCHFLKFFNLALQVQVNPDDYPEVLKTISQKRGLVILMVDLMDFPCSIWPGIGEIFGNRTPIVVVGNKVDLLPQDSRHFLQHVKRILLSTVKLQGFATFNIKEVALISAKTGFGVEDLITQLNSLTRVKGDVYIVGCTNVGKSSLFNAFLQSDYCKIQASDLIQRATTSVWPGTTLNLLKFPIKRPLGYRQYLRHKRLQMMQQIEAEESRFRKEQLKRTKNPKYASLIGHIGVTKGSHGGTDDTNDLFSVQTNADATGTSKMGINENSKDFAFSKWCYDTPGVVQPDQIIHLLTTDELLVTLPKELITPRHFCIKPNSSLFIAGLARLDYVAGPGSVRITVFASHELPITICALEDAEEIYRDLLGTSLFKVPTGSAERISKWPSLEMAKMFTVLGESWYKSSNDIVLSSAGWVAVAGRDGLEYKFQAWTPEKRGAYVRDSLLPHAVSLTGKRIKHSVAYNKSKFYLR